jgi:hypothetical protein
MPIAHSYLLHVRLLLPLLLALFLETAQAQCECLWQGSFNRAASTTDLVASGTIIAVNGNAFDLKVDRIILGKEYREVIRVWADNGKLCRPPVDDFSVGSQWLLAANQITQLPEDGFNPNTPSISYGRKYDYYLSSCGAHWLSLHDGYVSGNLINGQRWQWQDEKMNPVLLELVAAYLHGVLPDAALVEAARPQTASKKLMEETKSFIESQH